MDNDHHQPQSSPYLPQPSTSAATTGTPPPLHDLLQQQQQQLQIFWSYQRREIEQVNDFKNHQLPLARIKKIMKADEDVRMISAVFAKACELFILELTIRSWLHAEENKRRTLQKNDIAAAITRTDIFDFLVDIVPWDDCWDAGGHRQWGPLLLSSYGSACCWGPHRWYLWSVSFSGLAECLADPGDNGGQANLDGQG